MKIFETCKSFLKKKSSSHLRALVSSLYFLSEFISRTSIGKREIKGFFFLLLPGLNGTSEVVSSGNRWYINLDYSFSEKALHFPLFDIFIPQEWKILSINLNFRISTMLFYTPRLRNFLEKGSARRKKKEEEIIITSLTILYFIKPKEISQNYPLSGNFPFNYLSI